MATGDNILTALSVARQCHITPTHPHTTYIGHLSENQTSILWNGEKMPWHYLDTRCTVAMTGDVLRWLD